MSATPSTTVTLEQRIKAEASALGFSGAAIVPIGPPATGDVYRQWLDAGYAGEMDYLREQLPLKEDPAALLPGARSLIMVTLNYNPPAQQRPTDGVPRGRVARYAWGSDYHRVLWDKMDALGAQLERWVRETEGRTLGWRSIADSAPLLEREFAARGGLGWIGKNANLIHWEHGSWLFIGELLVDRALEPDIPAPPRVADPDALLPLRESCGTCTLCIEACPTQAIIADKTLDARRCISYLTIELRGPVPADLRRGMGDWVFGCDICQDVCPWNRAAPESTVPQFRGEAEHVHPSLIELLALDEAAFYQRYRRTPFWRTKRRGLLRNAAIALGNRIADADAPDPAVLAALQRALIDAEPLVRSAAAWALGQSHDVAARSWLAKALPQEQDTDVRQEIAAALSTTQNGFLPQESM